MKKSKTRNKRIFKNKQIHIPIDYIKEYFGINQNKKVYCNISSNIAYYIIQNFESLNQTIQKTNKKFENFFQNQNLKHQKTLIKENVTALEYSQTIINSNINKPDFFSFRLKDLSINYQFDTISPIKKILIRKMTIIY